MWICFFYLRQRKDWQDECKLTIRDNLVMAITSDNKKVEKNVVQIVRLGVDTGATFFLLNTCKGKIGTKPGHSCNPWI